VCAASLIATFVVTGRFHRLHLVSGSATSLVVWVALAGLTITALTPLANVFGLGFWGLRAVGFVSAVALAISTAVVAQQMARTQEAFASVLAIDPFLALDLHANPLVSQFMRLDAERPESAGTAELALKVADRNEIVGCTASQPRSRRSAARRRQIAGAC